MRFKSGEEMLTIIQEGIDLYNKEKEIYVFVYNVEGSICYYNINNKEAEKLKQQSKECCDGWAAFLGFGGWVVDDPSHELFEEGDESNLDWCNENYEGEWEIVNP